MSRTVLVLAVLGLVLAMPGSALAGPTDAQYGPSAEVVNDFVAGDDGGGDSTAGGGAGDPVVEGLPFTGLDIGTVAVVALVLIGTGLVLRRYSAPGARS